MSPMGIKNQWRTTKIKIEESNCFGLIRLSDFLSGIWYESRKKNIIRLTDEKEKQH